ncbi:tumor necrosis factor receptor superfamily member 10B-like isoform X2 [Excalfactoria chinensis]|uniref:tumor necrosis factor receptor superfamily member 10B-like isoform X2 n=1 Tax=Excalfactoria chinensis TaxID=46218 RepID=UPI003B3A2A7D
MCLTALRFCSVLLLFAKLHLGSALAVKRALLESNECPMGTHLAHDSIQCLPCGENEFTEHPNDFLKCLGCRICREDQVEVSPCIRTRNRQCACKNSTFCLPDHPCEMCQKCQTRCPKGQVRIAPCTPHSDLQCGPPLDASSSSSSIVFITVLLAVVLGIVLVFLAWRYCCRHHSAGDGGELSRKPSVVVNRLLHRLGIQDNRCNEQIYMKQQQQQQQLLAPVQGSDVPRGVELEEMAPRISVPCIETQKKLVPVPGQDPIALLRRSFDTFVNVVPFPDWKRFGRALDLLENDLYLAEQHDKGSREPFYQMLNTWLNKQGSKASVNTLLETLPRIGLNGVAVRITSELIKEGYFQYEVS